MKKLISKAITGVASASLIATLLAPAAFATTADIQGEISGNGPSSNNTITVSLTSDCTVKQKNETTVGMSLTATADTGNNTANSNTGSGVTINTGNATSAITVAVGGSSNSIASNPCCDCVTSPTIDNSIKGNGPSSVNKVTTTKKTTKLVKQKNKTTLSGSAATTAITGSNGSSSNTGGTVSVLTGASDSSVDVTVNGSTNTMP